MGIFRKIYTFEDVVLKLASQEWDSYTEFGVNDFDFRHFSKLITAGNMAATVSSHRDLNVQSLKDWLNQHIREYIYDPCANDLLNLEKFIKHCRHVHRINVFYTKETYMVWRSAVKALYYNWYVNSYAKNN